MKPSTKPIPTRVSNTYECLTNDDEIDNVGHVNSTSAITKAPRTETTHKGRKNEKKTQPAKEESGTQCNVVTQTGVVKTHELRNVGIMKKQLVPSAVMDLGTMIATNSGMLEGDNEDDASAMTGSTKKSETNRKIDIPNIFF